MSTVAKVIRINPNRRNQKLSNELSNEAQSAVKTSEIMTDRLILVAKNNDREAFAELFDFYAPRVKAYLLKNGIEAAIVDDVLQETFATVWDKAYQYDRNKATISTWIYTIARNKRIDNLRRNQRPEFDVTDPAFQPSQFENGEQAIKSQNRSDTIQLALSNLSPNQQKVLRLSFFEGQTYEAIAARLGIPVGTVKSRARLAFKKLRVALGDRRDDL